MKKFVLVSMCGLFAIFSFAQSRVNFTLNNRCEYIIKGAEKDFYVFPYEGETQAALYNKALMGVTKTFVSAKDVVSKVENSMISINSTHRIEYYIAGGLVKVINDVNYIVEMEFKDGKIKVNAPQIVAIRNNKGQVAPTRDFLLNSSGQLATGWERYLFVNDVINNILSSIKKSSNDDW